MSKVYAAQDWGFVGHQGATVNLSAGDEYDSTDPLVKAHPEMFTGRNPNAEEAPPKRGRRA